MLASCFIGRWLQRCRIGARAHPFDTGFLAGAALAGLLITWLAVDTFAYSGAIDGRVHFFTAQAVSMMHGRWDVPTSVLSFECFLVRHRCFGYFGITPSILRLPVVLLGGFTDGSLGRFPELAYFLLGVFVTAIGTWWMARQVVALWAPGIGGRRRAALGLIIAFASLGASPLLFLMSLPMMYSEAILWGVAFSCIALGGVLSAWQRPRAGIIVVILLADALAVSSRPTVGAAAILATAALGIRFVRRSGPPSAYDDLRRPVRWAACLIIGAVIALVVRR